MLIEKDDVQANVDGIYCIQQFYMFAPRFLQLEYLLTKIIVCDLYAIVLIFAQIYLIEFTRQSASFDSEDRIIMLMPITTESK